MPMLDDIHDHIQYTIGTTLPHLKKCKQFISEPSVVYIPVQVYPTGDLHTEGYPVKDYHTGDYPKRAYPTGACAMAGYPTASPFPLIVHPRDTEAVKLTTELKPKCLRIHTFSIPSYARSVSNMKFCRVRKRSGDGDT